MIVVVGNGFVMVDGIKHQINYYGQGKSVVIIQTGEPTHNYKEIGKAKEQLGMVQSDMEYENYLLPR